MKIEKKLQVIFGEKFILDEKIHTLKEATPLDMEIVIDRTKYESIVSSYSEVLRDLFKDKRIFVLTKIKENKNIGGLLAILFKNSKKAVMSQMKTFSPCFLIKCDSFDLLITQDIDKLLIRELDNNRGHTFILGGYRYKVANEIKL